MQANQVKVSRLGARLVRLQGGDNVETVVARLKADPSVEYAEPNYIYKASQTGPNDRYYPEQWGLPAIQAPEAWKALTQTSGGIAVAVVDTGVDYTHPDLAGRVDTANDKDYVNGDAAGDDADGAMDDNGHGTHVAGIVAALTNNGHGVAGVAGEYSVTILP
ncbi:MAG: S8 family serine peptidase, partial [Bacillota bacterium]